MISNEPRAAVRAEDLRRAFDRSFAEPFAVGSVLVEDVLAIRLGGDPYAIRLSEIVGLVADKEVTPLAGPVSELLGIAGFRGTLIPVYDLAALLGCVGVGTPRWLVLTAGAEPVGLAFDQYDGHLRLPSEAFVPDDRRDATRLHVHTLARTTTGVRPVIHVPAVLDTIKRRIAHSGPRKEQ